MTPLEFRFHKQGRLALLILAILLVPLIMTLPLAAWVLWRRRSGVIRISDDKLEATELASSTRVLWKDIARVGLLQAPVMARGLGGALARMRMGGALATHVYFKDVRGWQMNVAVSSFEHGEQIVAEIQRRAGKPLEAMKQGAMSARWPEPPASPLLASKPSAAA